MCGVSICLIVLSALFAKVANLDDVSTAHPTSDETAEETQHAICKIITQEIQTSANATIRRQLKGVCTTKQMERKFRQLERKLFLELKDIKAMLTTDRSLAIKTTDDYDYSENIAEKSLDDKTENPKDDENIVSVTEVMTRDSSWARTEIDNLNNTVYTLKGQKVYTYYWEVPNIQSILRRNGIHIRSPDLYVFGHQLCVQVYPNHLNSSYLGIQLRPSSSFMKRHKFTILDQFDSSKDINSQTLGGVSGYEGMYRVPYAKLQERSYLHNDAIVIKLTIYLNS